MSTQEKTLLSLSWFTKATKLWKECVCGKVELDAQPLPTPPPQQPVIPYKCVPGLGPERQFGDEPW